MRQSISQAFCMNWNLPVSLLQMLRRLLKSHRHGLLLCAVMCVLGGSKCRWAVRNACAAHLTGADPTEEFGHFPLVALMHRTNGLGIFSNSSLQVGQDTKHTSYSRGVRCREA